MGLLNQVVTGTQGGKEGKAHEYVTALLAGGDGEELKEVKVLFVVNWRKLSRYPEQNENKSYSVNTYSTK